MSLKFNAMFIKIQFTETAIEYIHYAIIGVGCVFILAGFTFWYATCWRTKLRNRKKNEDILRDWVHKRRHHDSTK